MKNFLPIESNNRKVCCFKSISTLPLFVRLAFVFIILIFFSFSSLPSLAQMDGTGPVYPPTGGFRIEGNLQANVPTSGIGDWAAGGTGTGGFVLSNTGVPVNASTTYFSTDVWNTNQDNAFDGGDKFNGNPNTWGFTNTSTNGKNDMNHVMIHLTTDTTTGHVWAILGADRFSNTGESWIDFEFFQDSVYQNFNTNLFVSDAPASTGGRTVGDFVLSAHFANNGPATFEVWRWQLVGSTYNYVLYTTFPAGSVYASSNYLTTVPSPWLSFGSNTYQTNTFIEVAVDLTSLIGNISACNDIRITTIFVKGKMSNSATANLGDFIAPIQVTELQFGTAEAGAAQSECDEGAYTEFTLKGVANPSPGYNVFSTTWSTVSYDGGTAPVITDASSDTTTVKVYGTTATMKLTVVTYNGTSYCTADDEVILTVKPTPVSSITVTGTESLCPLTTNTYSGPAGLQYNWSITGNGSISGSTTSQSVTVNTGALCDSSYTLKLIVTNSPELCKDTATRVVFIDDNINPTASNPPDIVLTTCNETYPSPDIHVVTDEADNCGTPVVTHFSDGTPTMNGCLETMVRTYKVTDKCGNFIYVYQNLKRTVDNTPPQLTGTLPGGDMGNVCYDDAQDPPITGDIEAQYTDNCGTVIATLVNTSITGDDCS